VIVPRATYRRQFRNGFGFKEAAALAPYLTAIGITTPPPGYPQLQRIRSRFEHGLFGFLTTGANAACEPTLRLVLTAAEETRALSCQWWPALAS
jgi:hypothetical protein